MTFLQSYSKKFQVLLMIPAVALALVSLLTVAFFVTYEKNPYQAELAFTEHSLNDDILGSVVPASCESNPIANLYPGDCLCSFTVGPCTGPMCEKTVSWSTNFNARAGWGFILLFIDGANTGDVHTIGSITRVIPAGGQRYELVRRDNQVVCSAFVPGPVRPTLTLSAVPATVFPNQPVDLRWTVNEATRCEARGGWSGNKAFSDGSHNEEVRPSQTTTYELVCSSSAGTTTRQQTVTVQRPTVTLTATPSLVGPGAASTLRWTVQGASACIASGGWTGVKTATNGSHTQIVNPAVTTSYTIRCGNVSGTTTADALITVPSGSISASTCVIPSGGTSCSSNVTWSSNNFLGPRQVLQGAYQFSDNQAGTNVPVDVTPDNRTFTLRDSGSSFNVTANSAVTCAPRSQWVTAINTCLALPIIELTTESGFLRPGSRTTVNVEITASYGTQCNFIAGLSNSFVHSGTPATQTYSFPTGEITSEQIITLRCNSQSYTVVADSASTTIEVIPLSQEI